jgi:hypothetical protein
MEMPQAKVKVCDSSWVSCQAGRWFQNVCVSYVWVQNVCVSYVWVRWVRNFSRTLGPGELTRTHVYVHHAQHGYCLDGGLSSVYGLLFGALLAICH